MRTHLSRRSSSSRLLWRAALPFAVLLLFLGSGCEGDDSPFGCTEDESDCVPCERNRDCSGGEVCQRGRCVEAESSEPIGVRPSEISDSSGGSGTTAAPGGGGVIPPGQSGVTPPPSGSTRPGGGSGTPGTGVADCRQVGCAGDEVCNRRTGACEPASSGSSGLAPSSGSCVPIAHNADWESAATCGDGIADEGCPCNFGEVQSCFMGPPTARRVGTCRDGVQVCVDRTDPRWGPCEGYTAPAEEVCDGRDNSCNGCVDDAAGADCSGAIPCPEDRQVTVTREMTLDPEELFPGVEMEEVLWRLDPPAWSNAAVVVDPGEFAASFRADVSGDYRVGAILTLEGGEEQTCSWVVEATGPGLRLELVWDTMGEVDLDLHLQRDDGEDRPWCEAIATGDCHWRNCQSGSTSGPIDWGYPRTELDGPCGSNWNAACTNPRLDVDTVASGIDAEQINLDNPEDGDRFRVRVQHFIGPGVTQAELGIWCGGALRSMLGLSPDPAELQRPGDSGSGCDTNQGWMAADIEMEVDDATGATSCTVTPLLVGGEWDIRVGTAF